MKRCVAPAHLMIALLFAAGPVGIVVFRRGADRVAETHLADRGWDGLLCDCYGDLRHVLDRLTRAAMGQMGTCGPARVLSLSTTWRKAGDHLGDEVPLIGTERYMAPVFTLRQGPCLPTRAGVDWCMRLSAARHEG